MPLLLCKACRVYTLKKTCPSCGKPAISPGPARYSPEDPYGEYRRKLKRLAREAHGTPGKRA